MNTIHKIRIGFAGALLLSVCVVFLSYLTTTKLIDTNRMVVRSSGAIRNLDGTVATLNNLERSRLAWVMAGRAMHDLRRRRSRQQTCQTCHDSGQQGTAVEAARFHSAHLKMIADLTRHTRELRDLIASDPAQQARLKLLEPLVERKITLAKQEIESQKSGGPAALLSDVLDREVQTTDEILKIIQEMDQAESKTLTRQLKERESTARIEILTIGLLGFLILFGGIAAYVIIRRDLSQREALEEQLRQTTKMEAVGRLAGGVAHDFNNLLTPIIFCADLLRSKLGREHPLIQHVEDIKKSGETAASVTRQLLAFSRRQTLQPQKLNLNDVAAKMASMLRRLVGEQYQLATVQEPSLGWVEADPSQMEQVIMNLVLNARDALPEGGIIAIETANVRLRGEKVCWSGLPLEGDYVLLTVSDEGAGMAEETCSRVFEPFFTTKLQSRGTGLGLATVYGIVTQSNGRVRIQTAPGQGTTFEIYLPRVEQPVDRLQPREVETTVANKQAKILLVEDDATVRRLLSRALIAEGHHLLEASDGEEGMLAAQTSADRIDLLITDVIMPRMNGLELHQKLKQQCPALRTVFISGHTGGIISPDQIVEGQTVFLAKPFTPAQLVAKIGQLLHDTKPTWHSS